MPTDVPNAVIVATARSPIGRADKGSLRELRPDDLAATIVAGRAGQGAAARPAPRSTTSTSAAACPAASRASTWPGWSPPCSAWTPCPAPRSPATAPRRCRPPGWRSTRSRPARATSSSRPASSRVSRYARGSSDGLPPEAAGAGRRRLAEPAASTRPGPAPQARAQGGAPVLDTTRAPTVSCPTSTWPWARPRRTSPRSSDVTREEMDEFGVRSQNLAEKAIADGFWAREITPVTTARRHRGQHRRRPPARASPWRRWPALKPVFRPDGRITAGNCCPLNDGAAAVVIMSDSQGPRAGHHPAGPDHLHRRHRPLPRDHGPRPGRGVPAGAARGPA